MHRSAYLVAAVACLAALAACSKKTETASTGTPTNTTATAPASSTPAAGPIAPATPTRKAGLWEQTVNAEKMSQTSRICLDEATEAKMKWWGGRAGKGDCSEQKITGRPGGGWTFHAVCAMGESGTITSDGEATGDFGSHYTVDVTSTTSGSPMPQANGVHKVKIDATWKGPCPADMKPGDVELPGGMKMNMVDAMDGKPAAGGAMDPAKLREQAMSGHMDRAQMEAMRKQAEAMAKAYQQKQ